MPPRYPTFPFADSYAASFADPAFWSEIVWSAADEVGVRAHHVVAVGRPGTNPVFDIGGGLILKLFTPFHGGREQRGAEAGAYRLMSVRGTVPVPRVVAEGAVFPDHRDWDWPFLVLERIPGEPLEDAWATLDTRERERLAEELGAVMRLIHDTVVTQRIGPDFDGFIEASRGRVEDELTRMGTLPAHLIEQAMEYTASYRRTGRTLVHSDLDGHHVLGGVGAGRWSLRAVIDFGDAKIGDAFYDWPALHLGLFRADRRLLARAREGYGAGHVGDAEVRRAMQLSLLHEWDVLRAPFAHVPGLVDAPNWDAVAETLWSPG